jgi:predicted amidohydrolase YtcJ
LAHIQLSTPEDVARVGRDHLYVAWTFAWMIVATGYDMTVIPFIEKIHGNSYRELHAPGSVYEANAYPVRAVRDAGGITAAGSDAPVAKTRVMQTWFRGKQVYQRPESH